MSNGRPNMRSVLPEKTYCVKTSKADWCCIVSSALFARCMSLCDVFVLTLSLAQERNIAAVDSFAAMSMPFVLW